jgi:clan AA aspartic protease (TIGR02281 family)
MDRMCPLLETRSRKMRLAILLMMMLGVLVPSSYGEMYKWVDEKGTVHFTDDPSNIPEKYRPDAETRKPREESSTRQPQPQEESRPFSSLKASGEGGITVPLFRRHELLLTEVLLNERVKRHLIVDSGASFILINPQLAKELDITIDENTPFIPMTTVSGYILTPLVTLKSVRVGKAEVENVEAVIHTMPSGGEGLLGNSFLNKFRVAIDSMNGEMTLYSAQGTPSPDRPGGYGRDYWVGQFRFYNRNLEELKKLKAKIERQGASGELVRVNNAIRYFENQLNELERKASFAGVPRNWRE